MATVCALGTAVFLSSLFWLTLINYTIVIFIVFF